MKRIAGVETLCNRVVKFKNKYETHGTYSAMFDGLEFKLYHYGLNILSLNVANKCRVIGCTSLSDCNAISTVLEYFNVPYDKSELKYEK